LAALKAAGATTLITDETNARALRGAFDIAGVRLLHVEDSRECDEGDGPHFHPTTAVLQFTSGSTGSPKALPITWENLDAGVEALARWIGYRKDDVPASWLPLWHDMGLVGFFLAPIALGASFRLMSPEQFMRRPVQWLDCFGRANATLAASPNFGLQHCVDRVRAGDLEGADFSNWRVVCVGSERVVPRTVARFAELLAPAKFRLDALRPAYGLAEATLAVTAVFPGDRATKVRAVVGPTCQVSVEERLPIESQGNPSPRGSWLVSCGRPLAGIRIEIADSLGRSVSHDHAGEIVVDGPSVADRAKAEDGRLWTGDLGFIHDGELFVLGRMGDSLSSNGVRIHAEALEVGLAESIDFGRRWAICLGSIEGRDHAVLVVESAAPLEENETKCLHALRARLSPAINVHALAVAPGAIPRTSSGKVRRRELWSAASRVLVNSSTNRTDPVTLGESP
jgi:acyl-CoA synthetase (AMP-forming)/AMP-acid ligase II